jgi:hypothetical protein
MPRSNRYYDDQQQFYQQRERKRRQFEDPAKQAEYDRKYDAETDQLFQDIVKEAVGFSANTPDSYGRNRRIEDSLENDEQLRYQLSYERDRTKADPRQDGSYALAEYPGLQEAIWSSEAGMLPGGIGFGVGIGSPKYKEMQEKQKRWAAEQKRALDRNRGWASQYMFGVDPMHMTWQDPD